MDCCKNGDNNGATTLTTMTPSIVTLSHNDLDRLLIFTPMKHYLP
jgi:hypothetical protein